MGLQMGGLSPNGQHVLFSSTATNLLPSNTDFLGINEIFIKNLQTGDIQSVTNNSGGAQANGSSGGAIFSGNGRYVLFNSSASNLVANDANNGQYVADVFVKDLVTGAIQLVNTSSAGVQALGNSVANDISSDGRYVLFTSTANNLLTNASFPDYEKVFLKDLQTGSIQIVSISTDGRANVGRSGSFSPDETSVLFTTHYNTELVAISTYGPPLIHNLTTGTTSAIATGVNQASFSPNGLSIIFTSIANNLIPNDTNNQSDIFVKNLQTNEIQLYSAHGASTRWSQLSPDGNNVVYVGHPTTTTLSSGFIEGQFSNDIYLKNLLTGEIKLVSSDANGVVGNHVINANSAEPHFSADGRYVIFTSYSQTLVPNDGNFSSDIFIKDLLTGKIEIVNTTPDLGSKTDTIHSSISYLLPGAVENLNLTGSADINGTGNALNNIINGNAVANQLNGGNGSDTLTGNTGADVFTFQVITESLVGSSRDIITDFSSIQLDKINLSVIDANVNLANDQAFNFIGNNVAFSNVAGQLRFVSATNSVFGDVNGDGVADFQIDLTGVASLTAGDFIL